ncbi:MAG: LCP family protein [Thermomicrobiales bacterium]
MLAVTILLGAVAAGTLTYLHFQLSDVGTISTPPPEVASNRLGGDERVTIDTSPAKNAVREAEREKETQRAVHLDPSDVATDSSDGLSGRRVEATQLDGDNEQSPDPGVSAVTMQDAPAETGLPPPLEQQATGALDGSASSAQQETHDSVTILLMGVDARPGEPIDVEVRPDTLAVLHLNGETGSCRMLSVPRDTRTELPGYGLSKINHALAIGGIPYQALVTQNLLGVEIDHYGLIDFSGIEGLVDAVGGVTVDNGQAFTVGSTTFNAGPINLDGEEALVYARYRGGADGDFGRIDRQQQIVRALISQTSGMDIVTGAYELLGAVDGHIKTDFSAVDLIGLAIDFRSSCTETSVEVDTLNGTVQTLPDSLLNMPLSFVVVDPADIEQKVEWLL